jgi:hypothetical protein
MVNHGRIGEYDKVYPIMEYMRSCLSRCGFNVTINHDRFYSSSINILFENFRDIAYSHALIDFLTKNGMAFALVATELIGEDGIPYAEATFSNIANIDNYSEYTKSRLGGFMEMVKSAKFVWCFLERTAEFYSEFHPVCKFFPVGHVGYSDPTLRRSPKDIDVVFFGKRNAHRDGILNKFVDKDLVVRVIGEGFGMPYLPQPLLLSMLDRAKIGLNLTLCGLDEYDGVMDPRFASCMRIKEMLDRDICIVSEEIPLDNPYKNYILSASGNGIADLCFDIIKEDSWSSLGDQNSRRFRLEMAVEDICKPVIEQTLTAIGF